MSDEMWTMRTENDDRVRRARSWLRKSKRARSDVERFLYLWISFNAAYGQTADKGRTDAENGRGLSETELQQEFLGNICEQDRSTRWLQAVVLEKECAGAIRDLARTIQCAVTRRHSSAGANPARQLSLQPVAVGADDGGNDIG